MSNNYIKLAFEELHKSDGLTIMGRGLGVETLFSKFVQYYSCKEQKRNLVFCLNANGFENAISNVVLSEGAHPMELPKSINNEINSQERSELYAEGGCYFITSRILIVDLLDNKVDCSKIAGLLVYNAHKISETSIESFIIRVYRERNREGFVKAFSADPEQLQNSFGKLERLMKVLFIRKLYLWPRFRLEIDTQLERNQPEVTELSLPLTPTMKAIQSAILVAMNTCLQELKRSTPQLETSAPLLTLENGLFQNFDVTIRNQLDSEWHKISFKSKQLVTDLSTLRKLLDHLIRYDAFSFYYLLLKLQAVSSEQLSPSLWLMSEAANHIFRHAKERVYKIIPRSNKRHANAVVDSHFRSLQLNKEIVRTLECPPKWKLLLEIVKEIRVDYLAKRTLVLSNQKSTSPASSATASSMVLGAVPADENIGRVLLIVKDDLASAQLRDILVNGEQYVMDTRYRWFVSQQVADIRKSIAAKKRGTVFVGGKYKGGSTTQLYQADQEVLQSLEENAPLTDATLQQNDTSGRGSGEQLAVSLKDMQQLSVDHQLMVIEEKLLRIAPAVTPHQNILPDDELLHDVMRASYEEAKDGDEKDISDSIDNVVSMSKDETGKKRLSSSSVDGKKSGNKRAKTTKESVTFGAQDADELSQSQCSTSSQDSNNRDLKVRILDPDLHIVIMTHSQMETNLTLLSDMKPACVILYDPDIAVIRTIEAHQSVCDTPLKLYFMLYEGSADEHRYVGSLAREKKAFDSLIAAKEHLVVALPDHPDDLRRELDNDVPLSLDTRTTQRGAGPGNASSKMIRQIVVDVREFRSTLPSILHYSRFAVVPRTIYVGDYVLSSEICVERKGISDLFQSFASGRLFNQAEAMSRHYKYPCLLIEFSADKAFALIAAHEITPEIQQNSIMSRIALLCMSFPAMKLLWSRSAASTVDIFRSIVSNHDHVDVQKAVTVGAVLDDETTRDGRLEGREDAETASAAQEILLSLPGINVHNFREIMNSVENLCDLTKMTVDELSPMIGPVNARKLVAFFRQRRLA